MFSVDDMGTSFHNGPLIAIKYEDNLHWQLG